MAAWSDEVLDRYRSEPALIGLVDEIAEKKAEFDKSVSGVTCRGNPYGFGGMRPEVSVLLYGLVRWSQPKTLVETGVCNGVSTAVILAALEMNGEGMLYSIDLPEYTETSYDEGAFWEGKKGAVVPKGLKPGWLIPDKYRSRWSLTLGRSREVLPSLLERLGEIDFFLHDSEHSYECMSFEYQAAWKHLRPGGLLVSDDITWNSSFEDFSRLYLKEVVVVDRNMAFITR